MHVKVAVRLCLYLVYFFLGIGQAAAQQADSLLIQQSNVLKLKMAAEDPWYETIQLRGYTQLRYNRLLETNPDLT